MATQERYTFLAELAVKARSSKTAETWLWSEVEAFIRYTCRRYLEPECSIVELDDYVNEGYFGFLKAIEYFDPDGGASFLGCLQFCVRRACLNSSLRKFRGHPASLDEPISGRDDSGPLSDLIPDLSAEAAFEHFDDETIVDAILLEVDNLDNPIQRRIIRECDYEDRPKAALADELGVSKQRLDQLRSDAIARIRRVPIIRALGKEFFKDRRKSIRDTLCSPYRSIGIKSFRSSFTSSVESIIMARERYEKQDANSSE